MKRANLTNEEIGDCDMELLQPDEICSGQLATAVLLDIRHADLNDVRVVGDDTEVCWFVTPE